MNASPDDRTELILALGRGLHQAGLSTDSNEETLRDVARALGVAMQINILPTSLTLAVGPPFSQQLVILRLEPGRLHLRKLALLEGVVTAIRSGAPAVEALRDVARIDTVVTPDPPLATIAAYTVLSCGAAMLLGGGTSEIGVAGVDGIAIGAIAALAQRSRRVDRVYEITAAFVATVIIGAWDRFVTPSALYVAIIAPLVQLLPGYSLTTALNELANRNLVSGTARLGGVFVTLLSLGCGFALAAGIIGSVLFAGPTVSPGHITFLSSTLAAALMALGIAAVLHARYRDLGWIVASCVATVVLARLFTLAGMTEAVPFATAFCIGLATTLAARYLRIPSAVVLVPSLLVLVPGSISYESLLYVFQADTTDAVSLAARALLTAILIVAGFLASQLLSPPARKSA